MRGRRKERARIERGLMRGRKERERTKRGLMGGGKKERARMEKA